MVRLLVIYLFGFFVIGQALSQELNPEFAQGIIRQMLDSIKSVRTLSYHLKNTERIDDELLSGEQYVKYSSYPKRCYFYMIHPDNGSKLYFIEGENDNQAVYDPSGFPYMKLHLDPMGTMMRNYNHHTIFEAGFSYIGKVLENIFNQDQQMFRYRGDVIWDGRAAYLMEMDNIYYGYTNYQAMAGESIREIAQKLMVNEYKIYELNPQIKKYKSLEEDLNLVVPNSYALKMDLLVDKENFLPVSQKIYDDKGLFEHYEYYSLRFNPKLGDLEFTYQDSKKK